MKELSIFNLKDLLSSIKMEFSNESGAGYSPGTSYPTRVFSGWMDYFESKREDQATESSDERLNEPPRVDESRRIEASEKRKSLLTRAYLRAAARFVPNAYFSPLLQPIRDAACVGIHLRRRDKVHAMGASEAVPSWETTVEGVWETNNRTLTLVKAISHR